MICLAVTMLDLANNTVQGPTQPLLVDHYGFQLMNGIDGQYIFRSWYLTQFEGLLQLHSLFDPSHGVEKLQEHNLTPNNMENLEQNFLKNLFKVMDKSQIL